MKIPQIPDYEISRLATLKSLSVLDTEEEERFNRLTRIAKKTFNVPIAVVSLIDENRQWFKSCLGLAVRETPRGISFCGHAILDNRTLVIPNALKDERFFDNPLVVNSPNIRFYAGCPLTVMNARLGTLCIIDVVPRDMSQDDLQIMKDLASLVEDELMATHLSTSDELTRIPNRRGFLTLIQNGFDLCKRQNLHSTLVFFDLNRFKEINDTFGHEEGDFVLRQFSSFLVKSGRDADLVGRLGGDEFVVWLSNSQIEQSEVFVARLKRMCDEFNSSSGKSYQIDFAYGAVGIDPREPSDAKVFLSKADILMYKNKRERR